VRERIESQIFSVMPTTPEELGAMVKRDIVRLGAVVKESGAKAPDKE
jgi:hypothetical protein